MLKKLFKKWWVILLQGILLIILAIYSFNHPGALLASLSFWAGILVLGTGLTCIFAYFSEEKSEKENRSLWWSIFSALFGLLMITNLFVTMKTISLLFGIWMISTGAMPAQWGWESKRKGSFGWIMLIIGAFSIIAGIMMLFDMGTAAVGISTILGTQALLAGIGFVILAFVKRSLVGKVRDKVADFKTRI